MKICPLHLITHHFPGVHTPSVDVRLHKDSSMLNNGIWKGDELIAKTHQHKAGIKELSVSPQKLEQNKDLRDFLSY